MAILVATLYKKGITVGNTEYKLMAKINSTRIASGYKHLFRKVKAKGKELTAQCATGDLTLVKDKKQPTKCSKTTSTGTYIISS